jgi:hypothetical protein
MPDDKTQEFRKLAAMRAAEVEHEGERRERDAKSELIREGLVLLASSDKAVRKILGMKKNDRKEEPKSCDTLSFDPKTGTYFLRDSKGENVQGVEEQLQSVLNSLIKVTDRPVPTPTEMAGYDIKPSKDLKVRPQVRIETDKRRNEIIPLDGGYEARRASSSGQYYLYANRSDGPKPVHILHRPPESRAIPIEVIVRSKRQD